MEPYRVNLDVYNGPLDLLLYLIRRDEVDIYDIPIADVTQQYCGYVEMIQQVDPNLAGEFLVMAATLLEIKSRMLLPAPPPEEGGSSEEGLGDPRSELVRQLLQYKAFKDAAAELRQSAEQQAMRFPRPGLKVDLGEPELEMENVQVWHLLEAFNKIMASIGRTSAMHEVVYDDTPAALHMADILDRLQHQPDLTFRQVFEGRTRRSEVVGLFLAMLELIRQKQIRVRQDSVFSEIYLCRLEQPEVDTHSEETMIASNDSFALHTDEEVQIRRTLVASAGAALEEMLDPRDAALAADAELLKRKAREEDDLEEDEDEEEEEWEEEQDEDEDLDEDDEEEEGEDEFGDEDEDEEELDEEDELGPEEDELDDEDLDELDDDDEEEDEDWDEDEEEFDEDGEDDEDEDEEFDDEDEEL